MALRPEPGPARAGRSSPAGKRKRYWYSSLLISSIRRSSSSPSSTANSSRRRAPYLSVIVFHPAAANISRIRLAAMPGTTLSSDCRLRSTIQRTSPNRGTMGSISASHTGPSSSSASPTRAIWRPNLGCSKWVET